MEEQWLQLQVHSRSLLNLKSTLFLSSTISFFIIKGEILSHLPQLLHLMLIPTIIQNIPVFVHNDGIHELFSEYLGLHLEKLP